MRSEAKFTCGAKNHQKWRRCQRCGAELAAAAPAHDEVASGEAEPSRLLSGWLIAAGIAVLVIGAAIEPRRTPEAATTTKAARALLRRSDCGGERRHSRQRAALATGTASDLDREASAVTRAATSRARSTRCDAVAVIPPIRGAE
jgi:hypothetical protein